MKWLCNFWKLRRQYDVVKIMFLLFLLGAVMAGHAVFCGMHVYQELDRPVEYILLSQASNGIQDANMGELEELEHVEWVSRQKQASLTVQNKEEPLPCYKISKDYLREVYQEQDDSAMRTFYVTPKAFEEIQKKNRKSKTAAEGKEELKLNYMLDDSERGIAKFVVLDDRLSGEEAYALCVENAAELSKDNNELRVYVSKKDLEGMTVERFRKLGYEVENMENFQETDTELQMDFLRMKYDGGICVLCFGGVALCWGMVKKEVRGR